MIIWNKLLTENKILDEENEKWKFLDRPWVFYDATSALKALGVFIFLCNVKHILLHRVVGSFV